MGVIVYAAYRLMLSVAPAGVLGSALLALVPMLIGGLGYLGFARALHVQEIDLLAGALRRRLAAH